jgi:hypothetical protein
MAVKLSTVHTSQTQFTLGRYRVLISVTGCRPQGHSAAGRFGPTDMISVTSSRMEPTKRDESQAKKNESKIHGVVLTLFRSIHGKTQWGTLGTNLFFKENYGIQHLLMCKKIVVFQCNIL